MRLYSLGNMYLLAQQSGIQCQHCSTEFSVKYGREQTPESEMYYDWADNHKTTILLNGGMHSHLVEFVKFLESENHGLPWAKFNESMEALNGALTNVSIVVPEHMYMYSVWTNPNRFDENNIRLSEDGREITIYNMDSEDPDMMEQTFRYSKWELELINKLASCSLMK